MLDILSPIKTYYSNGTNSIIKIMQERATEAAAVAGLDLATSSVETQSVQPCYGSRFWMSFSMKENGEEELSLPRLQPQQLQQR